MDRKCVQNQAMTIHKPYSMNSIQLSLLLLILAIGGSRCSNDPSLYKKILKNDYYAYVLPDNILVEKGWVFKPITNKDWDAHCWGGTSAPWNPLQIIYQDKEGIMQFSLNISNRDIIWERQSITEEINLNSSWIENKKGVAYEKEGYSSIKFVDIFGNEVVVDSREDISEIINLISQLEYIGPSTEEMTNPWSAEWCTNN